MLTQLGLFHACRELFRLPDDVDISLTFGCKEPMSGTHLKLEGMGAFDAAVHCASVAAAERQQKIKKSYSTGNLGSSVANGHKDGSATTADRQQQFNRSVSNNNIPANGSTGTNANNRGSAPAAAGLSAASAAQDRRRRFQDSPQQQQQPSPAPRAGRSRSFTVGSSASRASLFNIGSSNSPSSSPRDGNRSPRPATTAAGQEPPAAFRNILSMLGGSNGSSSSPFAAPAAQTGAATPGRPTANLPLQVSSGGPTSSSIASTSPAGSARNSQSPTAAHRSLGKKERLSLRNISGLTDVPEVDETVAVGSLSGKFKLTLKAFLRKVARSLSFTNKIEGAEWDDGGSPQAAAEVQASGGSSRVVSMPSPSVINYGVREASTTPRSMSINPLPPLSPSIRV
eukprot:GHRR01004303.1.p1 GENE.GHRR01004303.1~~GHRR01004303.1.p1  ORF type:complete len:398 (+),score=163.15 GHRR01004303.1:1263-2456(+)